MRVLTLLVIKIILICNIFADDHPYITTKTPITLLSANDGETAPFELTTPEGLADWVLKRKDSFTVIQLGPDHPPHIKTIDLLDISRELAAKTRFSFAEKKKPTICYHYHTIFGAKD